MSPFAILIAVTMIVLGAGWLIRAWSQGTLAKGWEKPVAALIIVLGIAKLVFKL